MSIAYYNAKTKIYADGTTSTIVFDTPVFRDRNLSYCDSIRKVVCSYNPDEDWYKKPIRKLLKHAEVFEKFYNKDSFLLTDLEIKFAKSVFFPQKTKKKNAPPRSDSLKRAKDKIFDYILSNEFDYFFTGTLDPKNYNSKDPKAILQNIQDWLKNYVKRHNLKYVFVAERHKSGAIHFHGLISGDNLNLVDSGTKLYKGYKGPMKDYTAIRKGLDLSTGRIVYNLPGWKFGFTTCINLVGDPMNTAFYITKYITKDCKKIFGKFFWHSRGLKKPEIRLENIDYDNVKSKEYFNEHVGHFKYIFRRGEENRRIEAKKKKSEREQSILKELRQLFYNALDDLVINFTTGEILEYETLLE